MSYVKKAHSSKFRFTSQFSQESSPGVERTQHYPDKPAFWDRSHKAGGRVHICFTWYTSYIKQNSKLQVLSLTSPCFLSLLLHVPFLLTVTASLQIPASECKVTGIFISLESGSPPTARTKTLLLQRLCKCCSNVTFYSTILCYNKKNNGCSWIWYSGIIIWCLSIFILQQNLISTIFDLSVFPASDTIQVFYNNTKHNQVWWGQKHWFVQQIMNKADVELFDSPLYWAIPCWAKHVITSFVFKVWHNVETGYHVNRQAEFGGLPYLLELLH